VAEAIVQLQVELPAVGVVLVVQEQLLLVGQGQALLMLLARVEPGIHGLILD
jgi:hypothetical protein